MFTYSGLSRVFGLFVSWLLSHSDRDTTVSSTILQSENLVFLTWACEARCVFLCLELVGLGLLLCFLLGTYLTLLLQH